MRVVRNNPALLPALVARGSQAQEDTVDVIAARTDLPREAAFPQWPPP